jgi:predicted dehydrogenase
VCDLHFRSCGKILQLDQQYRLRRNFTKLKEIVASGEIGSVRFVSAYLHRGDWNPASWKAPNPKTGTPTVWRYLKGMTGGSMMEDGIHGLDILHWVIGATVDRVYAAGGNSVFLDRETLDHAAAVVEYVNGVKLQFGFTLLSGGIRQEPMLIVGDKGTLHIDDTKLTLRKRTAKDATVIDAPEPDGPGTKDNPAMAARARPTTFPSARSSTTCGTIANRSSTAAPGRKPSAFRW